MAKKGTTRIEQVMQSIEDSIAARVYLPESRLPSVRAQAKRMQVSVSTVVEAYDRLAAAGVIYARRGSGYYVAEAIVPLSLAAAVPDLDRDVDPLWVSRQSLMTDARMLKPGCGWLPESWMYDEGMRRALRTVAREPTALLTDYGAPLGLPELRQLLAQRLAGYEMRVSLEQVLLTDSGTQAIDLLCRYFLQPDDTVLVDDPCYFNFHALLRAHRVKVVAVPMTEQGADVAAFSQMVTRHRPKMYITNSAIHNPTGAMLSPATAHQLLKVAEAADMVVVEDDIFADFAVAPSVRLAALDGLNRVIHIGSFSKSISAACRCGYIAARAEWVDGLTDLRIATSFGGNRLSASVLYQVLTDSGYRHHMQMVQQRLAAAMDTVLGHLAEVGITPWLRPTAGMFVWCELPEPVSAAKLAQQSLAKGVILAPGNVFSLSEDAGRYMRFNVAQSLDESVYQVLAELIGKMK